LHKQLLSVAGLNDSLYFGCLIQPNMTCKQTCLLLLVFLSLKVFSQTEDVTNVAKVTLLNPGLSYEARIGKFQTVYAQIFMNTSAYARNEGFSEPSISFYFDPAATLQYRYYYNNRKRLANEKRTDKNSLNYVALVTEAFVSRMPLTTTSVEEESRRPVYRFGAVWGLQRNFEKHFSVDLNLGLGYLTSTETRSFAQAKKVSVAQPTFMGQLNLGFWLGGK
jgi:hypothetical protein